MKVKYNTVLMQLTVDHQTGWIHNLMFPKFTDFYQFFQTFTDLRLMTTRIFCYILLRDQNSQPRTGGHPSS